MRNLQEQVKKAFCYEKLSGPKYQFLNYVSWFDFLFCKRKWKHCVDRISLISIWGLFAITKVEKIWIVSPILCTYWLCKKGGNYSSGKIIKGRISIKEIVKTVFGTLFGKHDIFNLETTKIFAPLSTCSIGWNIWNEKVPQ